MSSQNKIQSIDNLRVIATISVILLHVSASVALRYKPAKIDEWWIGNICDSMVRFCVPVFFMISGALLFAKDYSVKEFFRRRTSRIVYPFLFWSILYVAYSWYIQKPAKRPMHLDAFFSWMYDLILSGISYHFWFIYTLIGLYLIVPFVSSFLRNMSSKHFFIILTVWLLLIVANSIGLFVFSSPKLLSAYLPSLVGYLGYMLLGYFIFNFKASKKAALLYGVLLYLVGALVTVFGTYFITIEAGKYIGLYYNYLSLNVLMEALGVFLILKNVEIKSTNLNSIRDFISKNSFGVYFVHVMVLGFLFRNRIWWGMTHAAFSIPLITIITLVISLVVVVLLKKLPFCKNITG